MTSFVEYHKSLFNKKSHMNMSVAQLSLTIREALGVVWTPLLGIHCSDLCKASGVMRLFPV